MPTIINIIILIIIPTIHLARSLHHPTLHAELAALPCVKRKPLPAAFMIL